MTDDPDFCATCNSRRWCGRPCTHHLKRQAAKAVSGSANETVETAPSVSTPDNKTGISVSLPANEAAPVSEPANSGRPCPTCKGTGWVADRKTYMRDLMRQRRAEAKQGCDA